MDQGHLKKRLVRWGYFIGQQAAASGFPPESTISRVMSGSRPRPGSKVLIRDMPPDVWRMQFRITNLPVEDQRALIAHYALPPKDNGVMRTKVELAELLHCTPGTLRKRLYRARRKLAYMLDVSR